MSFLFSQNILILNWMKLYQSCYAVVFMIIGHFFFWELNLLWRIETLLVGSGILFRARDKNGNFINFNLPVNVAFWFRWHHCYFSSNYARLSKNFHHWVLHIFELFWKRKCMDEESGRFVLRDEGIVVAETNKAVLTRLFCPSFNCKRLVGKWSHILQLNWDKGKTKCSIPPRTFFRKCFIAKIWAQNSACTCDKGHKKESTTSHTRMVLQWKEELPHWCVCYFRWNPVSVHYCRIVIYLSHVCTNIKAAGSSSSNWQPY